MSREMFASLHKPASPLVLYNIWDAGSAQAVARAGAKAIATGSASLAGAMGYADGEELPLEELLQATRRIAAVIDIPLSVDFETGFADELSELEANARALCEAGAVGCNLEDQLIGADTLRDTAEQAARIAVVARAGLFVNARTDLFLAPLMAGADPNRPDLVEPALERAQVYKSAGAASFFLPGLSDPDLIARVCEGSPLPVNVMQRAGVVSNAELAGLGVARISYGPAPWAAAMRSVEEAARAALAG